MSMISFGIDFGTTNTAVVGCLTTENGLTTTAYGENNQPFPSLVALHPEKDTLFGSEVKKRRSQLISEGYTVLASFKTILGSGNSIAVGKKKYSPLDVTALFLAYIKERVEKMAGCAMNEAVMAIPVDFSFEQRADLREAAHRAGICIKSFVSEPTAAYVKCRDELAGASNVAVFDWGGGTLDISLISIENREVSELAVAGMRLGGNDIDQMLARHIHAKIMRQVSTACPFDDLSPKERDGLLDRAEAAKKRLSSDESAPVMLIKYAGRPTVRENVTLDEFSKLIDAKVNEAIQLLFSAADKAGVALGQMDAILMVGGSCEMQAIYQRIEEIGEEYHLAVCRPERVQWSVAGGAAILCEKEPVYKLCSAFGVLLSDDSFYPVFLPGQEAPCKSHELCFGVVEDTDNAIFVFADDKKNVLKRISVPIKGFTPEGIYLNCEIDEDMIVHIDIHSDYAQRMGVSDTINQLAFTYKI